MEATYKISVIVPVYNVQEYLKQCVDSLTGQTYRNLEILLVDDGSRDGSGALCDRLGAGDDRIRVIHKPNGGLVSAWKRGVAESTGAYLCFVDSDDWLDSCMMAEMAECLSGGDREIVASDYVIEHSSGRSEYVYQKLKPGVYQKEQIRTEVAPNLLGWEDRYVTLSRCMKLISRKLIEDNAHYSDERIVMGEDLTVMVPALLDCERLTVMDRKAYYHYRYVDASMAHKYDPGLYENIRSLHRIMCRVMEDRYSGEERDRQLKRADMEYIFLLFLGLKNEARGNAQGYRQNILRVCRSPEIKALVKDTPVVAENKANRLLYLVLRYPGELTVRLLRAAMVWYDRGRK